MIRRHDSSASGVGLQEHLFRRDNVIGAVADLYANPGSPSNCLDQDWAADQNVGLRRAIGENELSITRRRCHSRVNHRVREANRERCGHEVNRRAVNRHWPDRTVGLHRNQEHRYEPRQRHGGNREGKSKAQGRIAQGLRPAHAGSSPRHYCRSYCRVRFALKMRNNSILIITWE